jgi:regulatory subunit for Cdc7p protein kinase
VVSHSSPLSESYAFLQRVEGFFSKDGVTHFITNQAPEDTVVYSNKENHSRASSRAQSLLKSPIRLRGV